MHRDLDEVLDHARTYHHNTQLSRHKFDTRRAHSVLEAAINDPTTYSRICFVDGDLVGGMFGSLEKFPFSHDLYAEDLLLYTVPHKRSIFIATAIVVDYRNWALKQGASQVRIGTISGIDMERFGKFVSKLGFNHFGNTYAMEK